MRPAVLRAMAAAVALSLSTMNCGHGGGIGGTGLVVGVITAFGSVVVDDITFDTTAADITVNGEAVVQADLGLGMVVEVEGTISEDGTTGVADRITFESVLEGPIEGVFPTSMAADILGDTVLIDDETVIDGISFAPSDVGTVVVVSGFEDADGLIRATRIALRGELDTTTFRFSGRVRDLDTVARTFRIRVVTIDYSSALFDASPEASLRNDIEARITVTTRPVDGVLVADTVTIREQPAAQDQGKEVRIQGVITRRVTPTVFVINDRHRVRVNDSTVVSGGAVEDINRNTILGIRGVLNVNGVIIARQIVIRDAFAPSPTDQPTAARR